MNRTRKVPVTHVLDTDKKKLMVSIRFLPEFRDAVLSGRKIITTRLKQKADIGEEFESFGAVFVVTGVCRTNLGAVADHMYVEEGFDSKEDFMRCWSRIYPSRGVTRSRQVWIHRFRKVPERENKT